jgi:hypothetical protein
MPRAPLKVDELAIHRDPRAITDWNYLGRGRRHHDHHLCADPDSRYAGRYFLPRQRQLEVWTQIGFGIVNEFIGLLGGEPMSTTDGVGALQRHGRQLGGTIAVPYFVAQFVAHLQQRRVTAVEILDPDVVHVVEIGGGVSLSRAGPDDPGDQKWATCQR